MLQGEKREPAFYFETGWFNFEARKIRCFAQHVLEWWSYPFLLRHTIMKKKKRDNHHRQQREGEMAEIYWKARDECDMHPVSHSATFSYGRTNPNHTFK